MTFKKRIQLLLIVISTIIVVPSIAMNFTNEVNWQLGDFLAAIILVSLAWGAIELGIRFIKAQRLKPLYISMIFMLLILTWMHLAVGLV